MGAVNYATSDYITFGVRPYDLYDLENDADFMEKIRANTEGYGWTVDEVLNSYISECYEADLADVKTILSHYRFFYYHVTIKPGYYEGFTLDIENNFSCAYDGYKDRREAQKEITQLKKCLLELAGVGLVACYPDWCMSYEDYKGTCKAIEAAVKAMRDEVRTIPTRRQYERETV